ncbi:hypothetical protein [Streptomyces sp. NPDC058653]|uniref:hypothetical protein n=1 Tax=Streptomyces sp. NPDC058653 TaxID=3346576 RepID=UPI003654ED82
MTSARRDGAAGQLPRTARRYDAANDADAAPYGATDRGLSRAVRADLRAVGTMGDGVRVRADRTVRGGGAPCPHRLARTAAERPPLRSQS